eukprot:TRINITY_DN22285_c0_g1_i1.p1 TRINITY_DN22285_c0_g1~~TRINITY_DN22285_c0_g1_i1.p1  ORF type:complete len:654 (+),score=134.58 TRINITY_DN22285_c0_g1_i1:119-2080(+)
MKLVIALGLISFISSAATKVIWTGNDPNGHLLWKYPENWSPPHVPSAGDDVVIDFDSSKLLTVEVLPDDNLTVNSISLSGTKAGHFIVRTPLGGNARLVTDNITIAAGCPSSVLLVGTINVPSVVANTGSQMTLQNVAFADPNSRLIVKESATVHLYPTPSVLQHVDIAGLVTIMCDDTTSSRVSTTINGDVTIATSGAFEVFKCSSGGDISGPGKIVGPGVLRVDAQDVKSSSVEVSMSVNGSVAQVRKGGRLQMRAPSIISLSGDGISHNSTFEVRNTTTTITTITDDAIVSLFVAADVTVADANNHLAAVRTGSDGGDSTVITIAGGGKIQEFVCTQQLTLKTTAAGGPATPSLMIDTMQVRTCGAVFMAPVRVNTLQVLNDQTWTIHANFMVWEVVELSSSLAVALGPSAQFGVELDGPWAITNYAVKFTGVSTGPAGNGSAVVLPKGVDVSSGGSLSVAPSVDKVTVVGGVQVADGLVDLEAGSVEVDRATVMTVAAQTQLRVAAGEHMEVSNISTNAADSTLFATIGSITFACGASCPSVSSAKVQTEQLEFVARTSVAPAPSSAPVPVPVPALVPVPVPVPAPVSVPVPAPVSPTKCPKCSSPAVGWVVGILIGLVLAGAGFGAYTIIQRRRDQGFAREAIPLNQP